MTPSLRLRHVMLRSPLLSVRILVWSVVLRLAKHLVPLPRLARLMWSSGRRRLGRDEQQRIVRLTQALPSLRAKAADDNCLERSLVAYRYLSRSGGDPILVSGVRRGGTGIQGHAWVLLDGEPVHEPAETLQEFVPVVRFGRGGRRV